MGTEVLPWTAISRAGCRPYCDVTASARRILVNRSETQSPKRPKTVADPEAALLEDINDRIADLKVKIKTGMNSGDVAHLS
jgi:hypothetical protein